MPAVEKEDFHGNDDLNHGWTFFFRVISNSAKRNLLSSRFEQQKQKSQEVAHSPEANPPIPQQLHLSGAESFFVHQATSSVPQVLPFRPVNDLTK